MKDDSYINFLVMKALASLTFVPTGHTLGGAAQTRGYYRGEGTGKGRHKHAAEVRQVKKRQRRRAYYRMVRG